MPVHAVGNDPLTEIFDRHPRLPVLLLVLFPFALQLPFWLFGLSTDPIWYFSGFTHTVRILPWSPYFDPNAGFTSEALGRLSAWNWTHGTVPWWNSYSGVGMPLAGELQPGSFFLPFTFLFLLPEGLLWQRLLMQIIAGITTYALLRELGLSRLASVMGGALFSLNGVIAWSPGPAAVYCSGIFLPLLLWGIERARRAGHGAQSILAVGTAVGWSLLAGFPEPAYINGLLALTWGIYRLSATSARLVYARRALAGLAFGLMIASPLVISFVDYILQSDSFERHAGVGSASLSWAALPVTLIPIIYGPPGADHASPILEGVWGSIGGYTSLLIILLALMSFRRGPARGLQVLLSCWILICWARTFGVQPFSWIVSHLPLLGKSAFFRYAPSSWILALIILASYGLDAFRPESIRNSALLRKRIFSAVATISILCFALAWPYSGSFGTKHHGLRVKLAKLTLVFCFTSAELAAAWWIWSRTEGERRRVLLAGLLVAEAAGLFLLPESAAVRYHVVDLKAAQFLKQNQGLARNYTVGPLWPNYSAYFRTASIDHNVLPVPRLWAEYADKHLLPGLERRYDGVSFWPIDSLYGNGFSERMFRERTEAFAELGVRYFITSRGQDPGLAKSFSSVYRDDLLEIWELPHFAPYYQVTSGGPCTITAAVREQAILDCAAPAAVLRRELFMPGWEASANSQKFVAVRQSGIFQVASAPAGRSELRFRFTPPGAAWGWAACAFGAFGLLWQVARIGFARHRQEV